MNPSLKQSNPERAAHLEQLHNIFARPYNFKDDADKATFVEGLHCLAMDIAKGNKSASVDFGCDENGTITKLNVNL